MPLPFRSLALFIAAPLMLAACGEESIAAFGPDPPVEVGFVAAGDLSVPRHLHASTPLEDGGVLVCGGFDKYVWIPHPSPARRESYAFRSCEIFDPATAEWSAAPEMAEERFAHQLVTLSRGRVLAIGGQHKVYLRTVEMFDPAKGTWENMKPMLDSRINFTATFRPGAEERVLVAGGISDVVPRSQSFDITFNTWSEARELVQPRAFHAAVLLADATLLVAGGISPGAKALAMAERFFYATTTWSPAGLLREARTSPTLTLLPDGRAIVTGGSPEGGSALKSVEIYDPASNSWEDGPELRRGRSLHQATLLTGGRRLLVTGGIDKDGQPTATAELLDLETMTWQEIGPLLVARFGHTAHLLRDGRVLLIGGSDGVPLQSAELFTPPCASHKECAAGQRCGVARVCLPDPL